MTAPIRDNRQCQWGWFNYEVLDQYGAEIGAHGIAVYMVLVRHANNETQATWPAIGTIATKTDMSESTVRRTLAKLQEAGLITVEKQFDGDGRQRPNCYTLVNVNNRGVTQTPSGVSHRQGEGVTQTPEQDPSNKTHNNNNITSIGDTAIVPAGTPVNRRPDAPAHKPKPETAPLPKHKAAPEHAGWGYRTYFTMRADALGYALPALQEKDEKRAINELLATYPDATPDDLTRFLCYRRTCFGVDKASAILLSRCQAHFGAWYTNGQPATQVQNGGTHHGVRSQYESPAERLERETFASFASIYPPADDHQRGNRQEPPALPGPTLNGGIIDLNRRRLG